MNSRPVLMASLMFAAGVAFAAEDPAAISRGNMHFDPKAADANGDGMISKDEMTKYAETMWQRMARAESVSIPVADAARDFSRGNLNFEAKSVDADGDAMITKEEFMQYGETRFDATKNPKGMVSVADAGKAFGRGNQPVK
jgi:hypothetical protein